MTLIPAFASLRFFRVSVLKILSYSNQTCSLNLFILVFYVNVFLFRDFQFSAALQLIFWKGGRENFTYLNLCSTSVGTLVHELAAWCSG